MEKYNYENEVFGKVEVDVNRYDALVDCEARTSVLRSFICSILDMEIKYRLDGNTIFGVENSKMSIKEICYICGFQATYEGYRKALEKALENMELEKENKDGK